MIVYLTISSYRFLGLGQHYYGRLRCGDEHIDVMRQLSATEAATINQQRGFTLYSAGDDSISFHLESDVVSKALQVWRDEFPAGTLLVEGGGAAYAEPQKALAGPPELVAEINAMYQHCEELGWWDGGHEDEMLEICDRWDQVVEGQNAVAKALTQAQ